MNLHRWLLGLGLVACSCGTPTPPASRYLYVWAGTGHMSSDAAGQMQFQRGQNFLAILDVNPGSPGYGTVIGTVLADSGLMPHHSEFTLPAGPIFVNDYVTGDSWLIEHQDAEAPKVLRRTDPIPGFRHMHSFARLHDSLVFSTVQFGDSTVPGRPGALVMFSAEGRLLRVSSAQDSSLPGARIRPYGLTLLPAIDRAVTTSSPMDDERTANVIQVWRLSDLALLRTIQVPGVPGDSLEQYPFEVRTLGDGRTVMLNTYYCGFYRVTGLGGETPSVELVDSLSHPSMIGCAVPVVAGRYWIMPVAYGHVIVSMDILDPMHPRVVARLATDSTFYPHWLSKDPGSDRIVVTDQGDGPPRVMLLRLDPGTGQLSWDERFRESRDGPLGVSFVRPSWPNGITGTAKPHAAVFVP